MRRTPRKSWLCTSREYWKRFMYGFRYPAGVGGWLKFSFDFDQPSHGTGRIPLRCDASAGFDVYWRARVLTSPSYSRPNYGLEIFRESRVGRSRAPKPHPVPAIERTRLGESLKAAQQHTCPPFLERPRGISGPEKKNRRYLALLGVRVKQSQFCVARCPSLCSSSRASALDATQVERLLWIRKPTQRSARNIA